MTVMERANAVPTHDLPPITELVLQRGDMLLIDGVISCDSERVEVQAQLAPDHPLVEPQGIPCWVGVELMAQTVGAFSGLESLARGEPPRIGLLLGTRRYVAYVPHFPPGTALTVVAKLAWRDEEGVGVFDCSIAQGGQRLADAQLKGLAPMDLTPFLQAAIDD
jgi:predicted hotdog family 3-hydroxylacyl-ACP dehydratase